MNTEREIVRVAISLFKKNGYDHTTIGMICDEAKISKGTFYYHFQGKGDLIYAHVDSFISDAMDILPVILELENPKEQLWQLYKYAFENIVSMNPKLLLAYYKVDIDNQLKHLSPSANGAYMYYTNSYSKMIFSLIKKCQGMGLVRASCTAEDLMLAYSAAIIGTGLEWACQNGKYDEIERLKLIFDVIFSK